MLPDVRLYFDVEGCGLAAQDREMVARPTIVLLHGGPGADHSLFKPEFSAMADVAQVVYLDMGAAATRVGRRQPALRGFIQTFRILANCRPPLTCKLFVRSK